MSKHSRHSKAWRRTRVKVMARDGVRCRECGAVGVRFEVHHKVPVSGGGTDELPNLELLCAACHIRTHHPDRERDPDKLEWRQRLRVLASTGPEGEI